MCLHDKLHIFPVSLEGCFFLFSGNILAVLLLAKHFFINLNEIIPRLLSSVVKFNCDRDSSEQTIPSNMFRMHFDGNNILELETSGQRANL